MTRIVNTDPHKILGIAADADKDAIRKAYLSRAREWHPDVSDLDPIQATARFQALNAAYDLMKNPHKLRPHEVEQTYVEPIILFSRESFDAYRKRMKNRRTYGRTAKKRRRRGM